MKKKQNVMKKYWKTVDERMYFKGSVDDWSRWRELWFAAVPKCKEFSCCHELMSCGIQVACGACSAYHFQKDSGCVGICNSVSCADCMKKYECKTLRERERRRLGDAADK